MIGKKRGLGSDGANPVPVQGPIGGEGYLRLKDKVVIITGASGGL